MITFRFLKLLDEQRCLIMANLKRHEEIPEGVRDLKIPGKKGKRDSSY